IHSGARRGPGRWTVCGPGAVSREAARGAAGVLDRRVRPLPEVLRVPAGLSDVLLREVPSRQEPAAGDRLIATPQGQFRLASIAGDPPGGALCGVRRVHARLSGGHRSAAAQPGAGAGGGDAVRLSRRHGSGGGAGGGRLLPPGQGGVHPMSQRISKDDLRKRTGAWIANGKTVAGPVQVKPGLVLYAQLQSPEVLLVDGWIRPGNSIKEFVFPRHEALYGYAIDGAGITLHDLPAEIPEQIIIGAHPCDAAALPILDKLFNWDYPDDFFNRRREATTVITIACAGHDEQCFC